MTKHRRIFNRIQFLVDEEPGRKIYSEEDMGETVIKYFSNLYKSKIQEYRVLRDLSIFRGLEPQVTADQNAYLMRLVGEGEVKKTVFEMGFEKSPCPNCLT